MVENESEIKFEKMTSGFKINLGIVGSRGFNDKELFSQTMNKFLDVYPLETIENVVSGGAAGADTMGAQWAEMKGIETKIFLPEWKKYGKSAGIIRNGEIVEASDVLLAFWDGKSPGTKNSIDRAKKKGIPYYIIEFGKE